MARVVLSLSMVAIVNPARAGPPLIFSKCHRHYFVSGLNHLLPEASAWTGIGWLSLIFFAVLALRLPRPIHPDSHHAARRPADMYDMRREIFIHMQRLPMSYSTAIRRPPGTRVPPTLMPSTISSPPASSP